MKEYYLDFHTREGFVTLPQNAVKQFHLPEPSKHPACWDAILDETGKIIFSECSELTTGEIAKLSVYDPAAGAYRTAFSFRNYVFPGDRTIRDSKVHTSMSWMEDGRLVMVTHTTDKSPVHPAWLPTSYYNHIWEGYPGSSLLVYDPKSETLENYGIPVPRETLYGGAYDKIGHTFYAIGCFRGHLYGISMTDRSVTDYGQVTEHHSYRMVVGPDDNIYFTTRNGLLQRINVREKKVENLHIQLPYEPVEGRRRPYLTYGVTGPDGNLYLSGMHDNRLSRLNVHTGELTVLGSYLDAPQLVHDMIANPYIGSMAFDRNGILYYAVCSGLTGGHNEIDTPAILHRWDVLGGGQPEVLGIPGIARDVIVTTCTMLMDHSRHQLHMVGGNHALSAPTIVTVDLDALDNGTAGQREAVTDALTVIGNTENAEFQKITQETSAIIADNSPAFSYGSVIPVRLWETFDDDTIWDSAVREMAFEGEKLVITCGNNRLYRFVVDPDGQILEKSPVKDAPCAKQETEMVCGLPTYPGRCYKAKPAKSVSISGGRQLCATEDGLLAIRTGDRYFALGPAWINGPVQDMAATKDGSKVFGVAGDKDDLNIVFSYDDACGLRYLGQAESFSAKYGAGKSSYLTAIAVNDDATILAVGSGDRMGTVFIYRK